MKNPAIAIQCGKCAVPINPVLHPKPETVISCPECGANDTYERAFATCMEEVADRSRRVTNPEFAASTERPAFAWCFRY